MRDGSTQRDAISEVMDGVTKNYNPRQWLYATETPLQIVKHNIITHVYLPSVPPSPLPQEILLILTFVFSW